MTYGFLKQLVNIHININLAYNVATVAIWLQAAVSKLTNTPGPSNCGVSCPKLTPHPNQGFSAIKRFFV